MRLPVVIAEIEGELELRLRGTGDYAGISGGGRGAGVTLAYGSTKARFEGFLSPK